MYLSPIDMLTLYESDQDVIRCLIRRPRLTVREVSDFTKIPITEVNDILARLLQKSRVNKSLHKGDTIFSVHYESHKRQTRASGTSLMDSLFG